jgi:Cd2+/Zn2+-exporting ATPase
LLRDRERLESAEVVAALRSIPGMDELRMLTGDNPEAAGTVAAALGIEHVSAGLSPLEKVAAVQHMTARLGGVAMLGDGVNDAPALAAASVGIAMGAAGSDAALETADIALMKDDLRRLPWLIQHARATRLIVTQNIAFALGTKMLFMLLASVGMAGLWAAIAADTGASLLVTMNALRLLYRP